MHSIKRWSKIYQVGYNKLDRHDNIKLIMKSPLALINKVPDIKIVSKSSHWVIKRYKLYSLFLAKIK